MEAKHIEVTKILCSVDFSEYSSKSYDYAYAPARHYDAELFVLHATELSLEIHRGYVSPDFIKQTYDLQMAALQEQMRPFIDADPADRVKIETVVQFGFPADCIFAIAENQQTDLVVMGTHGRRGLDRLMVGSTLERVLRHARCAVVRKPARDSRSQPILMTRSASAHSRVYRFFGELAASARVCFFPCPWVLAEITLLHVFRY